MSVSHSNSSECTVLHINLLFSISCIGSYMTNNILSFKRTGLMSDHYDLSKGSTTMQDILNKYKQMLTP